MFVQRSKIHFVGRFWTETNVTYVTQKKKINQLFGSQQSAPLSRYVGRILLWRCFYERRNLQSYFRLRSKLFTFERYFLIFLQAPRLCILFSSASSQSVKRMDRVAVTTFVFQKIECRWNVNYLFPCAISILWYSVVVETTCPTKRKMSSGYVSLKKYTLEFLKSIRHVLACVFAPHFFNLYIWTMIDTIVFVSILIYPYFFFCNPSAVTRHKTAWQNDRIHCYDIASSIDSTLTTSHRHNAISCVSPRVLLRKFSTNYVIPRERCFSLSHYDRTP